MLIKLFVYIIQVIRVNGIGAEEDHQTEAHFPEISVNNCGEKGLHNKGSGDAGEDVELGISNPSQGS